MTLQGDGVAESSPVKEGKSAAVGFFFFFWNVLGGEGKEQKAGQALQIPMLS